MGKEFDFEIYRTVAGICVVIVLLDAGSPRCDRSQRSTDFHLGAVHSLCFTQRQRQKFWSRSNVPQDISWRGGRHSARVGCLPVGWNLLIEFDLQTADQRHANCVDPLQSLWRLAGKIPLDWRHRCVSDV
jgi:hypothetical protein